MLIPAATLFAATVKPLEVFSDKILVLEIEYFATEHSLNSTLPDMSAIFRLPRWTRR